MGRARTVHFDRSRRPGAAVPDPTGTGVLSRRRFLVAGAGAVAVGVVGSQLPAWRASAADRLVGARSAPLDMARAEEALAVLGKTSLRQPGSRPYPSLAAGTDTLPGIEHIVILMMENHSYDNFLGMLGRGAGRKARGDGFTLDHAGQPTASNPYSDGRIQHAFEMPTTCQLPAMPSQEWQASHQQYNGGKLDGFVQSPSGPVSMGYWTGESLPFTYALAEQFPIGDRFFCSLLGQTDPNRRYLIAATSSGMTDDIGESADNAVADVTLALPAAGTIFDTLSAFGISWTDYCASYPLGATLELYPVDDATVNVTKKPIADFFSDAAAGALPAVSLLDPDYSTQSQENPQNIVVGESFLAEVVNAIGKSPLWPKTLLVINYDEHGGYYDHVPPPAALAPDAIGPLVQPGEQDYDGFRRYGFRVPSIVVSPYAKKDYVSSIVYDHTSIMATIEEKWNLPALTYRDANANHLLDFIDLDALKRRDPTFASLPRLPASGQNSRTLACSVSGPGVIPPPGSISPAPR